MPDDRRFDWAPLKETIAQSHAQAVAEGEPTAVIVVLFVDDHRAVEIAEQFDQADKVRSLRVAATTQTETRPYIVMAMRTPTAIGLVEDDPEATRFLSQPPRRGDVRAIVLVNGKMICRSAPP